VLSIPLARDLPHITAHNFGSLGYGYGFALASDDLCTMANGYLTVEGQRSRYFGPRGLVQPGTGRLITDLDSDTFWQSVIGNRVIPRLLAVRTGPGAIGPQLRQLITGYVATRGARQMLAGRPVPQMCHIPRASTRWRTGSQSVPSVSGKL
jgi:acyl-homoserine-lactone acylase